MVPRLLPVVMALGFGLSSCASSADLGAAGTSTLSPGASPTSPATPATRPPTSGAASASCIDGWKAPKRGSALYALPLTVIHRTQPVTGKVVLVEMRYFAGPESPPSDQNYLGEVRRWYVKLYAANDSGYQGRFLVENRRFGSGVSAVAPYDTKGYASPDWSGFQWSSADPTPHPYPGLPGGWAGSRYDFVDGGQGMRIHGLPDAVVGCLDGT